MVPEIVVVVPALTGFLLTSLLWRHAGQTRLDPFLNLGLSVSIGFGLGIGICSYLFFVLQALNLYSVFWIAGVEAVLLACLWVVYRRRAGAFGDRPENSGTFLSDKLGVGLYGALALGISGLVAVATILAKRASHGGWDAISIRHPGCVGRCRLRDGSFHDALRLEEDPKSAGLPGCWRPAGNDFARLVQRCARVSQRPGIRADASPNFSPNRYAYYEK